MGRSKSGRDGNSELARVFHALGDPTRRAIVDRLSEGPATVTGLAGPLDITVTAVAQHLEILEASGLARTEKVGRVRTCRIEPAGFDLLERWIGQHRTVWEKRLDRLEEFLAGSGEEASGEEEPEPFLG